MFSIFYERGREFVIYQWNETYLNNFISIVKNGLEQNFKNIKSIPFNVQMNKTREMAFLLRITRRIEIVYNL